MNLALDPVNHRYTLGKRVLPSVTQVLGSMRMGTPDYSGIAPEVIERAGQRGTAVHGIIQTLTGGVRKPVSHVPSPKSVGTPRKTYKMVAERMYRMATGTDGYVTAAQKFCSEAGFTILRSEVMLHHPSFNYAGTVDCIGTFKDKSKGTVDWKTGELYPSVALQLVAYNAMLTTLKKMFEYRRIAVKLNRDGTYRAVEYPMSTAREDWYAFLAALTCYNWRAKYDG